MICNNCQAELDMILDVKQETNLYALTLNGDEEFWENRDSNTVEYLCPKCFFPLSNETVNQFKDTVHEH